MSAAFSPAGLSTGTIVRRREGVVLRHVAGEHLLVPSIAREVDLDSLFLVNGVGAFIWERLDGVRPVADLGKDVAQAFAADTVQATADVQAFLAQLLDRNLAEMVAADVQ